MSERRTVKDLLADAKDHSELMVDLAHAAIFFGDDDIAAEVVRLREDMSRIVLELQEISILAARSPEDAEAMAAVLQMAGAMDKIADAAEDIARVVLKDLGVPPELRDDLRHAEEVVTRVRIREENNLEGKTLEEAELPTETGMWVIAIRRDISWIFGPGGDTVLHTGDVIFAQGPEEGVDLLRELAGAPRRNLREPSPRTLTGLDRAVDLLVEMKNASEVAVGLAYSAILFRDKGLAAEVGAIEDSTDEMHHELERWVLRSAAEGAEPDSLRGLLHLAFANERIADAAQEMTRVIEYEDEPHPIISEALAETDEIVVEETVNPQSEAEGKSLRELRIRTEVGMEVLAIQRGGRWIYRPRASQALLAGDKVIAVGPEDGANDLALLFGNAPPEEEEKE
ncbi:MAG TPA: TrkA C-terminal domain-containing protein [Actinomycetota bacterium]|nr:TrkA C-terminal domain-containing protein [Actinomycetota bacterium]